LVNFDLILLLFDYLLNRTSIQLHVLIKRIRYESSWAWLSTLGGGHSCLGEESVRHVGINKSRCKLKEFIYFNFFKI
jgi:hypothetical protein